MTLASPSRRVRFGPFEADLRSNELFKYGLRVRIQEQPFQVLAALLEHPGDLVTRDELRRRLWADDTFVDFDAGLNAAVRRLRDALCDSNGNPKFVETLPRRGYRFVGSIDVPAVQTATAAAGAEKDSAVAAAPESSPGPDLKKTVRPSWRWEFTVAPTVLLALAIGLLAWRAHVAAGNASRHGIHSIAVLPLEDLSGDPAQEYFADGMTDALITDLAQITSLRVISRTSVMRYKGARKSLPEIARELSVDAVVEGTVVRSDDRVRVDAQLIRAKNEQHLWARSYDRRLNNILSLQNDVAREIASEIQAELTPQEQNRLAQARSIDPDAYEFYLRGRFYWNKRTEEGYNKAIEFFDRAIAVQPDYAQAYAGLADCYALVETYTKGGLSRSQTITLARSTALKAIHMDDSLAEAHASLASIMFLYDWDWVRAEKEFKRAIELNPNYATAHHWYAFYLAYVGRADEAVSEIRQAQRLDPLSLIINSDVAYILYITRRYDEAIAQNWKTWELDPQSPWPHTNLGLVYLATKRYRESVAEFEAARGSPPDSFMPHVSNPGYVGWMVLLGVAYEQAGMHPDAERMLREIRTLPREEYENAPEVAWLLAYLGRKDEAFAWLERLYPQRPRSYKGFKVLPFFDPLRSDPRMQDLIRRVGLPS
jgi:TolB-like protein/DNA-binding winged helix-turn-helix (wHTH) protein/Tfp pilus assembly protein PilF